MSTDVGSLKAKVSLDAVEFNKGIKELSQKMQIISQDFKLASGGLDKFKDAAEISRLKITQLTGQIEGQKKIVDQFRAAHQKASDQFGEGSKKALDYEVKLKKAENTLQSMERQLKTSTAELKIQSSAFTTLSKKMEDISKKANEFGTKMTSVGKTLSMGVTAPIVGIGIAVVSMGMDFEAQMSRVKAISQATGDEFTQLNDLALKLGADTAFSAKQSAEGMENLASAGFKTNEIMAAMPGMLNLAASGGLDVATASDIAASALRGFGLDANQSGHVADVLAKAAADTNASVTDMGMSLKYAAPSAYGLGMSLEEVSAAIGIMANAGIKGEMAGTTLRGSLISLASPSEEAASLMEDLGFNAFDAQGKMLPFKDVIDNLQKSTKKLSDEKKADALATIFGKESLSGMMTLIQAGPSEIDKLTKSFEKSDGAAKAMAETMLDNIKGSMEAMKGSLETAAITLSTVLAPSIIAITEKITELANKFAALSPETQKTILVIAGIAAAIGPVLVIVGTLITAVGAIAGVFATVSGAIAVLTTGATVAVAGVAGVSAASVTLAGVFTALTGPIGIAVAAVALLAAGGVLLANKLRQEVIPATDLFGDETSDATKKEVTAYMDLNDKVGVSLLSFQANNTKITADIAKDMIATFETMGTQIKAGRDKHYTEDLANLTKFYTDQGTLNSADAKDTLAKMKKDHTDKEAAVGDFAVKIKAIYDKAAADHRELTQKEEDDVKAIKDRMQAVAIQALTESEAEQKAILTRMRLQAKDISTLQASEVIEASGKQRDETTKLANDQYENVVNTIARQRDEGVLTSDDQAQKMIAAAERTRSETVRKAGEMHTAVVGELGKQNADVLTKLNESDGSVKTHWQNLKEWFSNNPLIRQIITGESTSTDQRATTHMGENATGTNNWRGGLTRVNEKGGEIMNLPRGTQIIPHDISLAIAKNSSGATVINFNIENKGTIVGSNGMKEFAKTVSTEIARTTGLAMGGAW